MREPKYRIWIKDEGAMCYGLRATSSQHFTNSFRYRKHEVVLMQYTGLKDKNGKEIYEGDIIKIIKHTSHEDMVYIKESIGVVKFYYGSFIMEVFREKDRKHVNYIRQLTDIAEFIKMDNVEVIGNIYENPELLEVK